ncbi:MAG: site-2 protease family protein [archaeon]|nr:site-2 protease family protein [archaeon]
MEFDFVFIILAFLLISLGITYLIKRFTKNDTYYLISLIKSVKPLPFFDRMGKHHKFLDVFATIGIIFGFGAVAIDFLYGGKLPKIKRALLFIVSFFAMSSIIVFIDFALGNAFSNNVLIGSAYPLLVASFGLMGLSGFTLFSLMMQAWEIIGKYLLGIRSCPGVAPLIPGVKIPGVPITPPLHAWISLIIILIVHEGMHGILGRRHGFKIKSTGVILFGFLPIGAFVEPDEKAVNKAADEKVLPFLAAGPTANLAVMFLTGLLLFGAISLVNPITDSLYPGVQENFFSGVKVNSVLEETSFCGTIYQSSAFGNLESGDIITGVNGIPINTPNELFSEIQTNRFEEKTFSLKRNGELIDLTLQPNEMGQYGFVPEGIRNEGFEVPESYFTYGMIISLILEFIYWLVLLNFLIALINFLPMNPFDGGRMASILFVPYLGFLKKSKEEKKKIISKVFLYFILALFIINALPLFF